MALVEEHQRVARQVVHQRRRWLARVPRRTGGACSSRCLCSGPLPAASPGRSACAAPAAAPRPACRLHELVEPLAQLVLDAVDGGHHAVARGHVVARWIDREARDLLPHAAVQRVEQRERLHLVVEQLDAQRELAVLGREHVDRVAAHAERATREVDLVARVLHADQLRDHVALAHLVAHAQRHHHLVVVARVADAVDRAHRGHDHDVAALQQALGRRQPHLLDVFVDRAVLLDVQVALRHVGLGLVVVVVADEVLDRVLRKELAELAVQLRRQRLVGGEHDRRPPEAGDHVGHREGLARAGDAQQRLIAQAVGHALHELVDRARLVARRRVRLVKLERRPVEVDELAHIRRRAFSLHRCSWNRRVHAQPIKSRGAASGASPPARPSRLTQPTAVREHRARRPSQPSGTTHVAVFSRRTRPARPDPRPQRTICGRRQSQQGELGRRHVLRRERQAAAVEVRGGRRAGDGRGALCAWLPAHRRHRRLRPCGATPGVRRHVARGHRERASPPCRHWAAPARSRWRPISSSACSRRPRC